jgi:hypothetical protein
MRCHQLCKTGRLILYLCTHINNTNMLSSIKLKIWDITSINITIKHEHYSHKGHMRFRPPPATGKQNPFWSTARKL